LGIFTSYCIITVLYKNLGIIFIYVIFVTGRVVEEWQLFNSNEQLYKINYKPSDCSHPKVVVDRARSRLGERQ